MKLLIQRVNHAEVTVDSQIVGKIGKGFLVFVGVGQISEEASGTSYF